VSLAATTAATSGECFRQHSSSVADERPDIAAAAAGGNAVLTPLLYNRVAGRRETGV